MRNILLIILIIFSILIPRPSNSVMAEEVQCTECHSNLLSNTNIHTPAEESCDNCHQSNGNEHPMENLKGFTMSEEIPALCYVCHDDVKSSIENLPVKHNAVREKKSCMNCHSPHSSSFENLIKSDNIELCLGCHNKSISTVDKQLTNIKQLLKNSKIVHGAIELDGCIGCHTSHASKYPFLLKSAYPKGEYVSAQPDSFALCFDCHERTLLINEVVKTETNFRNENQNLHFTHINGEKGRNCNVCHDMHGSQSDHLIADKVKFGNWKMPLNYSLQENGGSCLTGCHSEKKYDRINFFNNNPEHSIIVTKIETKPLDESNIKPETITLKEDTIEINTNNEYWKILEEYNKIITPKIKFEYKTTNIISGTEDELINVIDFMRRYPASKLEIDGHTDGAGENDYSISLSLMRAEKVKKMMVNFGISKERITTKGFGSTMTIASNKSEKTRAENRRVDLKLIK